MRPPVIPSTPMAPAASLLRMAGRGGVSLRRLHGLALLLARYTATEPFRLVERARLDRALDQAPLAEDPIFILGHWRSGTSHLQTLLGQDPRFTTPTLYRSIFSDISATTEPWLKPAMDRVARLLGLRFSIQRMPLQLDIPAEGDVGLCAQLSPCSYTWGHIFPRQFEAIMDRWVFDPSPADAQDWLHAYDRHMRKLSWAAGGRRVVMKSPGDTARLGLLAERYPGARFLYIRRDPLAVFHSNRYLWQVIRREFSLQVVSDDEVDRLILETYPKLLGRYLAQRGQLPPGRLVELDYADLRDDPVRVLRGAYETLGLGALPSALRAVLEALPSYNQQPYVTPPALEQQIRAAWAIGFNERASG